jgi:hypothetical protein
MTSPALQRAEQNMLFKLISEKNDKPVDLTKPAIMILPEVQSGSNDHPRVLEGLVFNTDAFDADQVQEWLVKMGQKEYSQASVDGLTHAIHFPDGTNINGGYRSFGPFDKTPDIAKHSVVGGQPAKLFIDKLEKLSASVDPEMQSAIELDPNIDKPMGKMKFTTSVVQL